MFKNVASQKVAVYAWDNSLGLPKTGDAGNITAQISKDGGATAATDDVNPTELDAADAKGIYLFDMLQAESNADLMVISPASSTPNIVFRPVILYTQTVMRGTDSANTTVPDAAGVAPTVAEIRDGILDDATRFSGAKIDAAISSRGTADPGDEMALIDAAVTAAKIAANAITAAKIATNAIGADELAASASAQTAAAVGALVVEGAVTLLQSLQISNAGNAGLVDGAGTTAMTVRDLADSKDRITVTVDTVGNRLVLVLDLD